MLKRTLKIFKYDLKSMVKFWWIVALITPIAALVAGVLFRNYMDTMISMVDNDAIADNTSLITLLSFVAAIEMIGAYIASIVYGVSLLATFIIISIRFFKNFYTDEGYLTFTLPVSRRELYLSKVASSMVVVLGQFAVMGLGAALMIIVGIPSKSGLWIFDREVWRVIFSWFDTWREIGNFALIVINIAIVIAAMIGSLFMNVTLLHFCITLGSVIVKRGKVFASIGCWYLVNEVFSSLITVVIYVIYILAIFVLALSGTYILIALIPVLLLIMALYWTCAFLFYNLTQTLIDKKLNLA